MQNLDLEPPFNCKKGYHTVKLKGLTEFVQILSNNLEKWLMEKGSNEKMIRKEILRAREHFRIDLLERESNRCLIKN